MQKIEKSQDYIDLCLDLKAKGFSLDLISNELNKKFGNEEIQFFKSDVKSFFNKRKDLSIQVLKDRGDLNNKKADEYLDTLNQLKQLNQEMWKFFYEIRELAIKEETVSCPNCKKSIIIKKKDYGTIVKTADHLLKQLNLNSSILGELKKVNFSIKYDMNDLSAKLIKLLKIYEKKGYIKIIDKSKRRMENEKNTVYNLVAEKGNEENKGSFYD